MKLIMNNFAILLVTIGTLVYAGKSDICLLPPDSGTCSEDSSSPQEQTRYYYSAESGLRCTGMPYSGCGGNPNNFKTMDECNEKCGKYSHETATLKAISAAQKNSQCWYKNRTYNYGDSIPQITVDSPHTFDCTCEKSRISCAHGEFYPPEPTTERPTQSFSCKYRGKDYFEGETIDTSDNYPCITCICNKNWKGNLTTEGEICKETNCYYTIHNQQRLVNKCEPEVYTYDGGKQLCCSIGWKCNNPNLKPAYPEDIE